MPRPSSTSITCRWAEIADRVAGVDVDHVAPQHGDRLGRIMAVMDQCTRVQVDADGLIRQCGQQACQLRTAGDARLGRQPRPHAVAERPQTAEHFHQCPKPRIALLIRHLADAIDDHVRTQRFRKFHRPLRRHHPPFKLVRRIVTATRQERHRRHRQLAVREQLAKFPQTRLRKLARRQFGAGIDLDSVRAKLRRDIDRPPQRQAEAAGLNADSEGWHDCPRVGAFRSPRHAGFPRWAEPRQKRLHSGGAVYLTMKKYRRFAAFCHAASRMSILAAAIALALLAGGAWAFEIERPADAIEVFHCDFNASWDANFDEWPDRWTRRSATGYPQFVNIHVREADEAESTAGRTLEIELDGASAAVSSPPIRVMSRFSYLLVTRLYVSGLERSEVTVSIDFFNSAGKLLQTESKSLKSRKDGWHTIALESIDPNDPSIDRAIVTLDVETHRPRRPQSQGRSRRRVAGPVAAHHRLDQ